MSSRNMKHLPLLAILSGATPENSFIQLELRYGARQDSNSASLLEKDVDVELEPLHEEDVDLAVQTTAEAFKGDPFQDYIRNTPDAPPPTKSNSRLVRWLMESKLKRNIRSSHMVTSAVEHGIAYIVASYASNAKKGKTKDRILDTLNNFLYGVAQVIVSSTEQKKRAYEFVTKLEAKLKEVLGDRVDDLNYLDTICTAPAAQGRGYGSALIQFVNEWSDSQGRATYLWSSNVKNTPFYNSHGFQVVGEILLGDTNPTWKKPPVKFLLMLREVGGSKEVISQLRT